MTTDELAAIAAREARATDGPWLTADGGIIPGHPSALNWRQCFLDNDTQFVGHAREDIPRLLAEVERLQEENERLREDCQQMGGLLAHFEGRTPPEEKDW